MKHEDEENVYEAKFEVSKSLPVIITSLSQNWLKKGHKFVHYVPTMMEK